MGVPRPLYPPPPPTYCHLEKGQQAEGGLAHGIGTLASGDPGHIINPSGPPVHTSQGVPSPIPSSPTSCGGGLGIRGEWGIEATVSPLPPSGEGGDVSETREDVL